MSHRNSGSSPEFKSIKHYDKQLIGFLWREIILRQARVCNNRSRRRIARRTSRDMQPRTHTKLYLRRLRTSPQRADKTSSKYHNKFRHTSTGALSMNTRYSNTRQQEKCNLFDGVHLSVRCLHRREVRMRRAHCLGCRSDSQQRDHTDICVKRTRQAANPVIRWSKSQL